MRFLALDLTGAFVVEPEPHVDERGFFARTFDAAAFTEAGAPLAVSQSNVSLTHRAGSIRGMHWQTDPSPEVKLVRCTRGAIFDVLIDRRPASAGATVSIELSADNLRGLYVPAFVAHGYQTLTDETEVTYDMDGAYDPEAARGVRFDDPSFGITWPLPVTVVSSRDRTWPLVEAS